MGELESVPSLAENVVARSHLDRFEMLTRSEECCRQVVASRRRLEDEMKRCVDRVDALVHVGELSSARQALEGATLTPGEATLNTLRQPAK